MILRLKFLVMSVVQSIRPTLQQFSKNIIVEFSDFALPFTTLQINIFFAVYHQKLSTTYPNYIFFHFILQSNFQLFWRKENVSKSVNFYLKINSYSTLFNSLEFDNPVWQLDYKFSAKYPSKGVEDTVINAMRMKSLSDNFINQTSDDVFTGFINSRQVRYQPDPFSRFVYYCAVRYFSQEDFNECHKNHVVPGG